MLLMEDVTVVRVTVVSVLEVVGVTVVDVESVPVLLVDDTVTVRLEELDVKVDDVAVVLEVCDVAERVSLVLDERVPVVLVVTLVCVTEVV